jgi:DNA-damage-inducible protein J
MARTARTNGLPSPESKVRAKSILKELGIPMSSAHELFYRQIIAHRGLPFDARIPNQETVAAMHDARMGKGKRYESVTELFKDCGL